MRVQLRLQVQQHQEPWCSGSIPVSSWLLLLSHELCKSKSCQASLGTVSQVTELPVNSARSLWKACRRSQLLLHIVAADRFWLDLIIGIAPPQHHSYIMSWAQVPNCKPAGQSLPVLHGAICSTDGCGSANHCAVDAHVLAQVCGPLEQEEGPARGWTHCHFGLDRY